MGTGRRTRSTDDVLAQALAEGRLWRAKEILGGRIGSCAYDPALYEQYGVLLLRMGDAIQAGRFLFLSGRRQEEYEQPIALYLQRHRRAGYRPLLGSFPAAVRRLTWAQLPAELQQDLRIAGVAETAPDTRVWAKLPQPERRTSGGVGCALVLLAVALMVAWAIVRGYLLP